MSSDSLGTTWLTRVRMAVAGGTLAALTLAGGIAVSTPDANASDVIEATDTTEEAAATWSSYGNFNIRWARATWS